MSVALLTAQAQISEYDHPCTILGQEEMTTQVGEPFKIPIERLVVHDVDDNFGNPFKLTILKGENYSVADGVVTPDSDFCGLLEVMVQVNDGKFDSNIYPLQVQVGERILDDSNAIYVATDGEDSNSGAMSSPVQTIQRAKELVKQQGAKVVYFREGDYFMDRAVSFDSDDSGAKGSPITYCAYPGERVRFTGSKALPYESFKKATPEQVARIENSYVKAKIKVIDLREMGITDYGEIDHVGYVVPNQPLPPATLVVDGASMHLSRYPNVGNFDDVIVLADNAHRSTRNVQDFDNEGTVAEKTKFKSKSGVMFNWEQSGDIWIDGSMSKAWEWKKNRIAEIAADSTITMEWEYHSKIGMQAVKMFYFNIFEELDFPEEYFIDRENGLLYVFFPSCVSEKSDIRLTQSREPLVELNGVNYIAFENIIFEGTRNSAILTTAESSYNVFNRCEVSSCGLTGIHINGYGNVVKNSLIHNVGAVGVHLMGGDQRELIPACNKVENCKIHDFSQERRVYNPGLDMGGVGQIARHIELYNGPHMAARLSGTNHIIEYSDFHDAPREYSDMLGIYLCTGGDFFSRGVVIRRNKFHDVSGSWKQSAGVYMDNETNGTVVEENYFYDNIAEERGWSTMIHGGGDNAVRRNVFVDCSYPFCVSTRLNGYASAQFESILKRWEQQATEKLNKKWLNAYPELMRYFDDGNRRAKSTKYNLKYDEEGVITNYWNMRTPTTNMFVDNLVYNADPATFVMPESTKNGNLQNRGYYVVFNFREIDGVVQECLIHDNNHNVTSDPNFVDYKNHDLRVQPDAPITEHLPHLKLDYYSKMGLTTKSVGVE